MRFLYASWVRVVEDLVGDLGPGERFAAARTRVEGEGWMEEHRVDDLVLVPAKS